MQQKVKRGEELITQRRIEQNKRHAGMGLSNSIKSEATEVSFSN